MLTKTKKAITAVISGEKNLVVLLFFIDNVSILYTGYYSNIIEILWIYNIYRDSI